jgi:hypothetical protein
VRDLRSPTPWPTRACRRLPGAPAGRVRPGPPGPRHRRWRHPRRARRGRGVPRLRRGVGLGGRARHADRFLGHDQHGRAQDTRCGKAGAIDFFYRFLELRYRGEFHELTGRLVCSPIDEVNRPRPQRRRHCCMELEGAGEAQRSGATPHPKGAKKDSNHAIVAMICRVCVAEWRHPDGLIAQCNRAAQYPAGVLPVFFLVWGEWAPVAFGAAIGGWSPAAGSRLPPAGGRRPCREERLRATWGPALRPALGLPPDEA